MAGPRDYLKKAGDIRRTMDGQPQRVGDMRIPAPAPMQMPNANSEAANAERTTTPASNYRPAMPLSAPASSMQQTYAPPAAKGSQRANSDEVGRRMAPSVQPPLWPPRASTAQQARRVEPMPAPKAEQPSQRQAPSRAEGGEDQLQRQTMRLSPQPIGGHALYRELMRSHDRMGTLHVKKEG